MFRIFRFLLLYALVWALYAQGASPPAAELGRTIHELGLDPNECYRVRDVSFTKDDIRLYFNDGYLIFSKPVEGQRLAAVFTAEVEGGDAEVIVIPPSRSERQSLAAFTQSPNLDEHIRAALMVFGDGSADALLRSLQEQEGATKTLEMGPVLAGQWNSVVSNVVVPMQVRLMEDLLESSLRKEPASQRGLVFIAVNGKTLGNFDMISDGHRDHRIVVRQMVSREGKGPFDVWTSFLPRNSRGRTLANGGTLADPNASAPNAIQGTTSLGNTDADFQLLRYRIETEIGADLEVKAVTHATVRLGAAPKRVFPFQIANAMRVNAVSIDGMPVELVRDVSVRSRITTSGAEDEFLVVPGEALGANSEHEFTFEHQGNVITTHGEGVYFVNARGSWYPHVEGNFATYDLTFRYPRRLTLVAAGDSVEDKTEGDWRITHRRTPVPIGAAGFNLGNYEKVSGTASGIAYEVYGNRYLEDALRPKAIEMPPPMPAPTARRRERIPGILLESPTTPIRAPDPLARLHAVAGDLSSALDFFVGLFGAPTLKTLTVAPIPGTFGQGFPGLVYLSTFAYLDATERPSALRSTREQIFFSDMLVPHEAAHQWWGSLITVRQREDDWLIEALANYSALMWLEKKKGFKEAQKVLDGYRDELLRKDLNGGVHESAGPIVWGERLDATPVAGSWRVITYCKGTWIMHMLRRRMGDEAFLKMLSELRRRYQFRSISTEQFWALAREMRPKTVSAEAMDAFFDNWVYSTGVPSLKVRYTAKGVPPAMKLSGTLEQSDVDDNFSADVPVEIQFGRGVSQTVWVRTGGDQKNFLATVRQTPTRVGIPDDFLMKR